MKINFTKKEYSRLIELLFLGEWMLTANDDSVLDKTNPHHQLIQKIYSHAAQMQCDDKISYAKELDSFFPTREFEDSSMVFKYIDQYDEHNFWDELISRMGKRDLEQIINHERLSQDQRFKLLCQFEDQWADEFIEHGLTRLGVTQCSEEKH